MIETLETPKITTHTEGTILYRSPRWYAITPHKDAPIFSADGNPQLVLKQLIQEIASGNSSTSETIMDMFRQASLVNLYFYLTVVAGFSGPYNELNDHLHLDMANFRQSSACMEPGARGAMFLGRSHYKSTVGTHGALGWEVIRNPNIRIGLYNAVIDKAYQFLGVTMDTFKNNMLFKELFPEFVIPKNQAAFLVPARTRTFPEPTIKVGGVGGSSAGDHFDLADLDDIVSEQHLTGMREASAEMGKISNWYSGVKNSILQNQKTSRLIVKGTRYGIDDPYGMHIFNNCKKYVGFLHSDFEVKEDGEYTIYYRRSIENGQVIFPEAFTLKKFEVMAEEDWWQYQTQYMNDPHNTGMSELRDLETKKAALIEENGEFVIRQLENPAFHDNVDIFLKDCDVVIAIDPAATKKGVRAKNCRSAIVTWAMDCDENKYLIKNVTKKLSITEMFDEMFNSYEFFKGHVRKTYYENNAFQKILEDLIPQEELRRKIWVNSEPISAKGDKNARIRSNVGKELRLGKVWLCEGEGLAFTEEKNIFPQSDNLKDCLDASDMAFVKLIKPLNSTERFEQEEQEEEDKYERCEVTGY